MKTRLYESKEYEKVYTEEQLESREELIESMRDRNIAKYRVKSIWAGDMLEVEGFPLWTIPQGKRGKKENESTLAQKRINDRNTIKRITRIVHTNFTNQDLWSTWTYNDKNLPKTEEQAKKNMTNFIRRQRHWLSKQEEYKDFELKYIYVTEFDEQEGKKTRIHHHMISNFPDRDILEDLWNGGGRVQTRRLQPDDYGLEGVVRYILKERRSGKKTKRYTISRNMKKPKETVSDTKMTRKRAERIACGEVNIQELFEKLYPKYQFLDVETRFSDFTSGAYIYVRMKRIEPIINTRRRE